MRPVVIALSVLGKAVVVLLVVLVGVAMVFPLFWLASTSLRPAPELTAVPPTLLPHDWTLANYGSALSEFPFGRYLVNSIVFSTVSTIFVLVTSTIGGYILAKFEFPGNGLIFGAILATAIVPFEIYLIPLYLEMNSLRLVSTVPGLVLPYLVLSIGIFFMRQNVQTSVPDELLDAARIDGLSETGIMLRLVPRLLGPALSALAIFAFLNAWTAFIWPVIILNDQSLYTLEIGLQQFNSLFTVDYGVVSAASMLSLLPPLVAFLVLRRQIIQGVTLTGLK